MKLRVKIKNPPTDPMYKNQTHVIVLENISEKDENKTIKEGGDIWVFNSEFKEQLTDKDGNPLKPQGNIAKSREERRVYPEGVEGRNQKGKLPKSDQIAPSLKNTTLKNPTDQYKTGVNEAAYMKNKNNRTQKI